MNEDVDYSFEVSGGEGESLRLFNIDGSDALPVDVWVEALEDKWFWQEFFVSNEHFKFDVREPDEVVAPDGKHATGCDRLFSLEKQKVLNLGVDCIFCVDSDDVFIKSRVAGYVSRKKRQYVYLTNIYAIDNAFISPNHVDSSFVTLSTKARHRHKLLPSDFIKGIASAIWVSYTGLYYLEACGVAQNHGLSQKLAYLKVESLSRANVEDLASCAVYAKFIANIAVLTRKVLDCVELVGAEGYDTFIRDLERDGVTADNFFLFMRGHSLFDAVIGAFEVINKKCKEEEIAKIKAKYRDFQSRIEHVERNWQKFGCYLKTKFSPVHVQVPFLDVTLQVLKDDYSIVH